VEEEEEFNKTHIITTCIDRVNESEELQERANELWFLNFQIVWALFFVDGTQRVLLVFELIVADTTFVSIRVS
jgi:hypothetical protein